MPYAPGKIADAEFGDLVTDSMRAYAATVAIPADVAGLAQRARRRHRRRRYLVRSGLSAGVAAAVAVAVALATGAEPQRAGPGPLQAQTLAYVVSRAERSLASSASTEIGIERDAWHGPDFASAFLEGFGGTTPGAQSSVTWTYRNSSRTELFAARGRPLSADGFVLPVGRRAGQQTEVDYLTKTWWRAALGTRIVIIPPPATCQWAPFPPATSAWMRHVLRCGFFRLAGRQVVNGISAIKIVSRTLMLPGTAELIWIDPATYLPVRSLLETTTGKRQWAETDYQWVAATPRYRAMLTQPIPAGFRRVAQPSLAPIASFRLIRPARTTRAPRKAAASRPTP
jgi:hypothetical protein